MKKSMVVLGCLMMAIGFSSNVSADVTGTWATVEGKSHIKIDQCDGEKFCGTISWLKEPNDKSGAPKKDANNQNEKLRTRLLIGISLLKGLEKIEDNLWDDGHIYNPEDGQIYSSEMEMIDENTLQVKGCVLFFCKKQIWNRVQ